MQMGELVAQSNAKFGECPFVAEAEPVQEVEEEDVPKDDLKPQANNAGKLGANLIDGRADGKPGTFSKVHPAPSIDKQPREDTARAGVRVTLKAPIGEEDIAWPFTVAAHHLIPGNAALKQSRLNKYMLKGSKVKGASGSFTIKENLGYNINGGHNGVWLPGSYALNDSAFKEILGQATKWKKFSRDNEAWAVSYIASVCRAAGGMFHDTHTDYNRVVKGWLNKISTRLEEHPVACEDCPDSGPVPPPYVVKTRLYSVSAFLKGRVTSPPAMWNRRLVTFAKRWYSQVFSGRKVSSEFESAYRSASRQDAN